MMPARIRILLVTTSMAGGAGLYAYQLARYIDRERFDLQLVFGPGYPLDRNVAQEELPHHVVRWSRTLNPLKTFQGAWDLLRLLRRRPVDVVHAQCSLAGAIARPLAHHCGIPHVVFTQHAFASRDYQPLWRKNAYLAIERSMDRYTDHYYASSNAIRDKIVAKRISRSERITVIPQGIDIAPPATPDDRMRARAALGLRDNELGIATAGRLEQQKGIVYLIRAWPHVASALPQTRLLIFGDGPLYPALRAEAERLGASGTIRFMGWRDDVAALMPGMDLFCLPSLWESFGYVLLDAMAAGVPVVASAVEGIPEVVSERCGSFVPPAEPLALARALNEVLRDKARRAAMGDAARTRVEREFTVSRMVRRFEEAYSDLVARRYATGSKRRA